MKIYVQFGWRFLEKKWRSYLAKNDFWRKVFRGTAKGPRPTLHSFCKAEIRNLKKKKKSITKIRLVQKENHFNFRA